MLFRSKRYALSKFRALTRETEGDFEAREMKIEHVGRGWLHICTEQEKQDFADNFGESDIGWYVSWAAGAEKGGYKVYVYDTD